MFHNFSDPCRAHMHLMGLEGRGVGSEVTDHRGPEVQHRDVIAVRLTEAE